MISPTDAWAVGAQENGERPLIAHWNGRTWRTVVGPVGSGKLTAVDAAAADDVWAVGYKRPGQAGANTYRPVAEHWDGSRWRSVPMPAGEAVLTSVAAVSSSSVWVGDRLGAVLRWDRRRWRVRATGQTVNAIAATSEDDVWLVGSDDRVAASHWNGKAWAKTNAPDGPIALEGGWGYDVAVSSSAVWAVGGLLTLDAHTTYGAIYRWDGKRWRFAFSRPNMDMTAITAITARNAWVIARSPADIHREDYGASLMLHWNGSRWQPLPRPKSLADAAFADIAAAARNDIWAVGTDKAGKASAAHYTCTR